MPMLYNKAAVKALFAVQERGCDPCDAFEVVAPRFNMSGFELHNWTMEHEGYETYRHMLALKAKRRK